jgi:hypothetical protein
MSVVGDSLERLDHAFMEGAPGRDGGREGAPDAIRGELFDAAEMKNFVLQVIRRQIHGKSQVSTVALTKERSAQ